MLKVRVIPTLLWKDVGLVKGVGFDSWRRVGPVVPAIRVYNLRDVDELIVVDITATRENRPPDFASVAEFSAHCTVPLTVGGGLTNVDEMQALLRAGADKVCLNSAFFDTPELVKQGAELFGSQCIVVSLDVGPGGLCHSHSGSREREMNPVDAAQRAADLGAGEILLTSIASDGTMAGYDLALIGAVSRQVNIPVIASGGAGKPADFVAAVVEGGASAVAAASLFHFTELTPRQVKLAMADAGLPVRL
ncbi:imidazole glycerol phosphate synthase subunit HisF [bacterium]|nr:imidazole glycerol phosphate synthase subunit HisF [bacterium]